jgi:CubicO group peptidase (beta-lactamase class C family)
MSTDVSQETARIDELMRVVGDVLDTSLPADKWDVPLAAMGLDSLAVVELQEACESTFGVKVPIPRLATGITFRELSELIGTDGRAVESDAKAPTWTASSHVKYPSEHGNEFTYPVEGWTRTPDQVTGIAAAAERLPKTIECMERLYERGDHPGAQLHVSVDGETIASVAYGMAESNRPLSTSHLIPWLCSAKPLYSIAFGQLWERGLLSPDTPVAQVLPDFGRNGKERVTFAHLLSHSSGIHPDPLYGHWDESREQMLDVICRHELPGDTWPGLNATYSGFWAWFVLAEAIEAVDGREISQYTQDEILAPLGLQVFQYPGRELFAEIRHQISPLWQLPPYSRPFGMFASADDFARRLPGVNVVGSAESIARIYEVLLPSLASPIITRPTADAINAPRRNGNFDPHYSKFISYGMGVVSEGWYWGPYCSPRTFGHQGNFTNFIVADGQHNVVIACLTNAMRDSSRDGDVVNCVYEDLGYDTQPTHTSKITRTEPEQDPMWVRQAEDEHYFWGDPSARER